MNKKLMVLAVAAATAPALALADDSTVTLYGTLNVDFENVKAEGCTSAPAPAAPCTTDIKQRNRVSSNSSNIGFRGVEPLMPGLDAWFQVESSVPLDAGGGTWASRNSGVGLKGNFGSVVLGQWDSPYKVSTGRLDVFGNTTIGAYTAIMGGNGSVTSGNAAANALTARAFDRRVSNTLQYWTPNMAGFSGRFAYGANEEKTSSLDPRLFSLSASYDNGPLYVTAAYEEHKDFGSLVAGQGKDTGLKAGASYDIANIVKVGAIYEQLKYKSDVNAAALSERKVKNWFATVTFHPGPHAISLNYGKRGKNEDTTPVPATSGTRDNTDAQFYAVRYGYSLSKRTELWAAYAKVDNESAAQQDFGNNGLTPAVGADPEGFGVGFIHRF